MQTKQKGAVTQFVQPCCRQAIDTKRCLLESLQKKCTAAQAKLEGEAGHLGSLEARTLELENLRKVSHQCSLPASCIWGHWQTKAALLGAVLQSGLHHQGASATMAPAIPLLQRQRF